MALRTRGRLLRRRRPASTPPRSARTSRLVSSSSPGYQVQPNKAIVGAQRLRARSGHPPGRRAQGAHAPTRSWTPADVGLAESATSCSASTPGGTRCDARWPSSAIQLADDELDEAFHRFLELADKKKEVFDEDLEALVGEEIREREDLPPRAVPRHAASRDHPDGQVERATAGGDTSGEASRAGPVDAVYQAIDEAVGVERSLTDYQSSRSITAGMDALGEVRVAVEATGRDLHRPRRVPRHHRRVREGLRTGPEQRRVRSRRKGVTMGPRPSPRRSSPRTPAWTRSSPGSSSRRSSTSCSPTTSPRRSPSAEFEKAGVRQRVRPGAASRSCPTTTRRTRTSSRPSRPR